MDRARKNLSTVRLAELAARTWTPRGTRDRGLRKSHAGRRTRPQA